MASPLGALGEIAQHSAGEALAFGLGFALGRALEPAGVEIAQEAWDVAPLRAVDAGSAVGVAADDPERTAWARDEARKHGFDADRFDALLAEALAAPGVPELLTMIRRGTIKPDDLEHGFRKAKLEGRWDAPLAELRNARLDPSVVAAAIVRGLVKDPGILPVGPPSATGKIPAFPVFDVDALQEAAAAGIDLARLSVMVGNYGRPMSPEGAASATFRGILERVDFDRAISEGDVRNEWADAIFEHARAILSPVQYVEAFVRDWISRDAMLAGTAKHGMSPDDADLLFKVHGRPLSWHQVFIGSRRGGVYDGPLTDIDPAFLKSLRESDIRPEWYHLTWAQRYSYPAAFVLRGLTQSGDISQAEANEILLFEGWEPKLAATVSAKWAGGTGGAADSHVGKAQTHVWNALHKSYVNDETDDALAHATLSALDIAADSQRQILTLWGREREIVRLSLTPTQIKKAFGEAKFSRAEALTRLERLGMKASDAGTFLDE